MTKSDAKNGFCFRGKKLGKKLFKKIDKVSPMFVKMFPIVEEFGVVFSCFRS